jgi:hypothetical protein
MIKANPSHAFHFGPDINLWVVEHDKRLLEMYDKTLLSLENDGHRLSAWHQAVDRQ